MTNRQEFCATLLAVSAAFSVLISIKLTVIILVILCAVLYFAAGELARKNENSGELIKFYRNVVIHQIQKRIGGKSNESSNSKHTKEIIQSKNQTDTVV